MSEWVEKELNGLDLGDKRLDTRAKMVIDKLAQSPGESIPRCFKSWAETFACSQPFRSFFLLSKE